MSLRRMGVGTALIVAGAFVTSAQAAPVTGGAATKTLLDPAAMVQKTQVIVFGDRRWCFYYDAWNGPGWYWCDYGWRRGYGWGGGPGWRGWRYNSRAWHQRHRGWDRGGERRRTEQRSPRRGRDETRGSERRSIDGRSGGRDSGVSRGRSGGRDSGMSRGRSGGREGSSGRSGGRSDGGRGASSGRGGGGGGERGGRGGRS